MDVIKNVIHSLRSINLERTLNWCKDILSTCRFVKLTFCQLDICRLEILLTLNFVDLTFVNLPFWQNVNFTKCQGDQMLHYLNDIFHNMSNIKIKTLK